MKGLIERSIFLAIALLASGCATATRSPYTAGAEAPRNPLEAQRLTAQALAVLEEDSEKADRLLREALAADLFHGPAHNNLGVLHLERGEMYAAAEEFEWARRLMPGHPDPRLNLALTLERVGRIDDAIEEYRSALGVYPGHIQTMQALARCRLRHGEADENRNDPEMLTALREIAMRGESEAWREWARKRLALADADR